jgi:DNA-binding NarL/FixJ family response regulator
MVRVGLVGDIAGALTIVGTEETPMPRSLQPLDPGTAAQPGAAAQDASAPLRVMIAEPEALFRAGLRFLLEGHAGISVVAEAGTAADAAAAAVRLRPDVVLLDVALAGGGIEATRQILAALEPGETSVLMLMSGADDDIVFAALRAGAIGMLLKDAEPEALVEAVRVVADGGTLLAPRLAGRLVADYLSRPERLHSTPEQLEELTAREREVVALVACGLSNEEIAERLVVTRATAKTHVGRALCKLHARDRAQLVVLAYECGLVRPGPRWGDGGAFAAPISRIAGASGRRPLHAVAA